ncbi:hypothetical protein GCM10023191_009960 [Actinoallomurus oryzae]|uniref:DUF3558 domain-containing protein n=2 Tax=Actinoallomurus oryzae TaxID=502180 RepID=A0ABP8PFJ6_9ACTN
MQPPYSPGPYQGPSHPGPPYPGPPGHPPRPAMPGAPPRRSRGGLLAILLIAGFLVVVVLGVVLIIVNHTRSQGRFEHAPAGCWLLGQAQIQVYVPGAGPEPGLEGAACTWEASGTNTAGRVHVYVETFDRSTVKDAEDQYGVRRRQADEPGVTIVPLSSGDESFMACNASKGSAGSCESYTRLSNQVFRVEFESFEERNARDPASVVRTLTEQATRHLDQAGR